MRGVWLLLVLLYGTKVLPRAATCPVAALAMGLGGADRSLRAITIPLHWACEGAWNPTALKMDTKCAYR